MSPAKHCSLLVVIFALAFLAPASLAQVTDITNSTSVPIPGAGHDYIKTATETVDPANGSVSLRIAVPVPPGRGLKLPFSFAYDSQGIYTVNPEANGPDLTWTSNDYLAQGGWSYTLPRLSIQQTTLQVKQASGNPLLCPVHSAFVFQDSVGGRHTLGLYTDAVTGQNCPTGGNLSNSGVVYRASAQSFNTAAADYTRVADADGTTYSWPGTVEEPNPGSCLADGISTNDCSDSYLPTQIEDRNGNQIVIKDLGKGAFTVTDTLDRSVLSSSGFGQSGNTVTVSGLGASYSLTWESIPYDVATSWTLIVANGCGVSRSATTQGTRNVVSAITLPNGKQYVFSYDSTYGLVNKITYPSGGFVQYSWGLQPQSASTYTANGQGKPNQCLFRYDKPAILHRYVSFDGSTIAQQQDFSYSTTWSTQGAGQFWASKQTIVTTTDKVRGKSFKSTYVYAPTSSGDPTPSNAWSTSDSQITSEQTITYAGEDGTTLRTDTRAWYNAQQLKSEQVSLNGGPNSQTTYTYGPGNVLVEKDEYDFGASAPTKKTVNRYQSFADTPIFTSAASILDRPCQSIVSDGAGNRYAETDYFYDNGSVATPCGTAGAPSVASVSATPTAHDETNYSSNSTAPRGNVTTTTRKCLQSCSDATTSYTYDETGQVTQAKDAQGDSTALDYGNNFDSNPSYNTNAYLHTITDALKHVTTFQYAFSDGQLIASTDQNSNTTYYHYNDSLRRLTETDYPGGGKATITYNDASYNTSTPSPSITTSKAMTSSTNLTALTAFDGLGHTVRSVLTSDPDCATGDRVDTTYDGLGRVLTVSNPYCTTADQTYGLTTYAYDALNRTTQVTNPDNSTILTTYLGGATQVQDEGNGNQRVARVSQTDALSRLASVCEVSSASLMGSGGTPGSCGQAIAATGFLTTYQYDVLGNLLQVNQTGIAARTFTYDSLSRLLTASNPESGTLTYKYDADTNCASPNSFIGDLISTVDARGIRTCLEYDALHRLTQKAYSDGTLPALFGYDQTNITMGSQQFTISNSIGRLSWTCVLSQSAPYCPSMTATSYDQVGRIAELWQANPTNNNNIWVSYGYDLLGDETNRNLNGNTFAATYNGAGRMLSFSATDYTDATNPANLLAGEHYDAFGHLTSVSLANGLSQSWRYNSRSRLAAQAVGTTCSNGTCSGSTVYGLSLTYAPNTDVLSAADTVNGNWTYSYDALNRLTGSNKNSGAAVFSYVYDRFGNRWQQNGPNTFTATFTGNNPGSPQNNNRVDGYSYDAAGNMLKDGTHSYTYDAENHLVSIDSGATTYTYDAEGQRVTKTTSGTTTGFIYDREGHIILPNPAMPTAIEMYAAGMHFGTYILNSTHTDLVFYYNHADWLSTERARTNLSGAACETITSLPFGDGQTISGSCGDLSAMHFTGKERDPESGLDNFGARYNSSAMGRFMSADSKRVSAHLSDPQTFNRYPYARNNPLLYVDPDGKDFEKAAQDLKTFAKSIYLKISIGVGYEAKVKVGAVEAKLGAAAKATAETSQDAILKVSRSAEAGASAGPTNGPKGGENISAEQIVLTINKDGTLTGAEKPTVTITDTIGGNTSVNSSPEQIGLGLETPLGPAPIVGAAEVGTTREGLNALKDAASEFKDSLNTPGPPLQPKPPAPPCSSGSDKKCP